MTWHVEAEMLERYARETVAESHAYSIEAHLLSCEVCRIHISSFVDRGRLNQVWSETEATVLAPKKGPIERGMLRLGVTEHVARLLAATPSLRLSWLGAIALALAFAVAASHFSAKGYVMFLILAPMLPVAGVAIAFGPGVDPTYEIGVAAPMRSFELLLIRAVAVMAVSGALIGAASLALPELNWVAAAWLLPSLGLTITSLALGTFLRPLKAAASVAVVWLIVSGYGAIVAARSSWTAREIFGEVVQLALLLVTIAGAALLYQRRDSVERGALR